MVGFSMAGRIVFSAGSTEDVLCEPEIVEAYKTSGIWRKKPGNVLDRVPYWAVFHPMSEAPPCNVVSCSHYQFMVEPQSKRTDLEMYTLCTLKRVSKNL